MNRALILYDSVNENVKKVAMAITRGLEAGNVFVNSIPIEKFDINELNYYKLIAVGVSTNSHGLSNQMKLFLKKMKKLKIEAKYRFVFETRTDKKFTESVAKRISKNLKNMGMKMIHPTLKRIPITKDGPLEKKIFNKMEQIGLKISEKMTYNGVQKELNKSKILKYVKLILFGGGPIFFFIRAIQLASFGGDTFGRINPIGSWILLSMEISISGISGIIALASLIYDLKYKTELIILNKLRAQKLFLIVGIITYVLHFIRVAIWLSLILP